MTEFIDCDENVYGVNDVIPWLYMPFPLFAMCIERDYWKDRALDVEKKLGIKTDQQEIDDIHKEIKSRMLAGAGLRIKEEKND